jgi:ElaB/YqjD/DUF883 family membrane-anchored ribosome-binding protein
LTLCPSWAASSRRGVGLIPPIGPAPYLACHEAEHSDCELDHKGQEARQGTSRSHRNGPLRRQTHGNQGSGPRSAPAGQRDRDRHPQPSSTPVSLTSRKKSSTQPAASPAPQPANDNPAPSELPAGNNPLALALTEQPTFVGPVLGRKTPMAEHPEAAGQSTVSPKISETSREQAERLIDRTRDAAGAIAGQAEVVGKRVGEYAGEVGDTVKQHPYATIAIAAGLAFAVGALWKIRSSRRQSHLDALVSRLPALPSSDRLFSRWR